MSGFLGARGVETKTVNYANAFALFCKLYIEFFLSLFRKYLICQKKVMHYHTNTNGP